MKRIKILTLLLFAALLSNCSKDDTIGNIEEPFTIGNPISFTDAIWTKGSIFTDGQLTSMEIYAYDTGNTNYNTEDASPQSFMTTQATRTDKNSSWSYPAEDIKYWVSDHLTFFAVPTSQFEITPNADINKLPKFTYTMGTQADDVDDITAAAAYDQSQESSNHGAVNLQFRHALTRISIYGGLKNFEEDDDFFLKQGITNVKYYIDGITFFDLESKGDMSWNSEGKIEWNLTPYSTLSKIEYSATRGVTFADQPLNPDLGEGVVYNGLEYFDVSKDGVSIFALPQNLNGKTLKMRILKSFDTVELLIVQPDGVENENWEKVTNSDGEARYVEIAQIVDGKKIYKTTSTDQKMIHETAKVAIPSINNSGKWNPEEGIKMYFAFDCTSDSYEMPMTITSAIFDWAPADINIDAHENVYVYSSDPNIKIDNNPAVNNTEQFTISTNYEYNLCVPHHRRQLDNEIITSRGFLFTQNNKTYTPILLDIRGITVNDLKDAKELVYVTKSNLIEKGLSTDGYIFGNNGYAYERDGDTDYMLYYNPDNENSITRFPQNEDGELDLSKFGIYNLTSTTTYYRIKISDNDYFDYYVIKTARNSSSQYSAPNKLNGVQANGINKDPYDPVYTLNFIIKNNFLATISTEMISNGGGLLTQSFPITMTTK